MTKVKRLPHSSHLDNPISFIISPTSQILPLSLSKPASVCLHPLYLSHPLSQRLPSPTSKLIFHRPQNRLCPVPNLLSKIYWLIPYRHHPPRFPTFIANNHLRHDTPGCHILIRLSGLRLLCSKGGDRDGSKGVQGAADEVVGVV